VSTFLRNTHQRIEQVEGVELIEKYERIVYSMDSGISLKRKALLRSEGSSPFFGTKSFRIIYLGRIVRSVFLFVAPNWLLLAPAGMEPALLNWEEFNLHRFRKTGATRHHEGHVSVRKIQAWLGHESLEEMLDYLGIVDAADEVSQEQVNNGALREFV
jgi:integrase